MEMTCRLNKDLFWRSSAIEAEDGNKTSCFAEGAFAQFKRFPVGNDHFPDLLFNVGEYLFFEGAAEYSIVPDACEPLWQDVQGKSPNKFCIL